MLTTHYLLSCKRLSIVFLSSHDTRRSQVDITLFWPRQRQKIPYTQTAFDYDFYSPGLSFFYLLTCTVGMWALQ